jgi:DNA repair exonuclease SbcCD nuclease subunit
MPENQENEQAKGTPWENFSKKLLSKAFWALWGKVASGTLALTILGFMLSWGFTTLNNLEEKVAKLEQNEKEDTAQWQQILRLSQETRENEIEIKVLLKLYDRQHTPQEEDRKRKLEAKAEEALRELSEELERLEKESKRSTEQFRNEAIQQHRIQGPPPQPK